MNTEIKEPDNVCAQWRNSDANFYKVKTIVNKIDAILNEVDAFVYSVNTNPRNANANFDTVATNSRNGDAAL